MAARHLRTFPSTTAAIAMINPEVMQDNAWDYVYNRYILRDERRPLMWTVAFARKYRNWPTSTQLKTRVKEANECTEPTALNDMRRAVDHGMIEMESEGTRRFYFLPGNDNLSRLIDLLARVRECVAKQLANPEDPLAGIDLFEGEEREKVYFNVVALM